MAEKPCGRDGAVSPLRRGHQAELFEKTSLLFIPQDGTETSPAPALLNLLEISCAHQDVRAGATVPQTMRRDGQGLQIATFQSSSEPHEE